MTVWTGWRDCVLKLVRLSSYTIQKVAELLPIMHSHLGFLCVEQMCTLGERVAFDKATVALGKAAVA